MNKKNPLEGNDFENGMLSRLNFGSRDKLPRNVFFSNFERKYGNYIAVGTVVIMVAVFGHHYLTFPPM